MAGACSVGPSVCGQAGRCVGSCYAGRRHQHLGPDRQDGDPDRHGFHCSGPKLCGSEIDFGLRAFCAGGDLYPGFSGDDGQGGNGGLWAHAGPVARLSSEQADRYPGADHRSGFPIHRLPDPQRGVQPGSYRLGIGPGHGRDGGAPGLAFCRYGPHHNRYLHDPHLQDHRLAT